MISSPADWLMSKVRSVSFVLKLKIIILCNFADTPTSPHRNRFEQLLRTDTSETPRQTKTKIKNAATKLSLRWLQQPFSISISISSHFYFHQKNAFHFFFKNNRFKWLQVKSKTSFRNSFGWPMLVLFHIRKSRKMFHYIFEHGFCFFFSFFVVAFGVFRKENVCALKRKLKNKTKITDQKCWRKQKKRRRKNDASYQNNKICIRT